MLELQQIRIDSPYRRDETVPVILWTNLSHAKIDGIKIFVKGMFDTFSIENENNEILYTQAAPLSQGGYTYFDLAYFISVGAQKTGLSYGDKLYVRGDTSNGYKYYSPQLVLVPKMSKEQYGFICYGCTEDAFGFPFKTAGHKTAQLEILLNQSQPQFIQTDKTYEKSNGEVVTLYAKYYKEWQCETDFISEALHNNIMAALSCDVVYINSIRVTKSDNYVIDWENYDIDCDGVTKLAKATFKVRENIAQRNSNY